MMCVYVMVLCMYVCYVTVCAYGMYLLLCLRFVCVYAMYEICALLMYVMCVCCVCMDANFVWYVCTMLCMYVNYV